MKEQFFALINNRPLISAVLAWAIAQILKMIHSVFVLKEVRFERLIGPGGMPSSHSATVVALMVTIARQYGIGSPLFAIAFALAIVVMYDAVSVRWQAGEHAKALNIIIQELFDANRDDAGRIKSFKEVLGHTPLQVLIGVILGFIIGFAMPLVPVA